MTSTATESSVVQSSHQRRVLRSSSQSTTQAATSRFCSRFRGPFSCPARSSALQPSFAGCCGSIVVTAIPKPVGRVLILPTLLIPPFRKADGVLRVACELEHLSYDAFLGAEGSPAISR